MSRQTEKGARISECGAYRYTLTRDWPVVGDAGKAVFVMLNPSTADARVDDPTIRRCIGFADSWGCSGLIVANLYALRSPKPRDLWRHADPVGPENDNVLRDLAREHSAIVCAWGGNAKDDRVQRFVEIIDDAGGELLCLATTKAGAPRHPLYLRADLSPIPWPQS